MMENEEIKKDEISLKLLLVNAILVVLILVMVFFIYSKLNKPQENLANLISTELTETKAFSNIELNAKSAYVYDVYNDKVLYKKNEFVQLPLASITKLMTAMTAVESPYKNSDIKIEREFLSEEGDSGLLSGETWALGDLLDFTLVVSSNDGARAIASVIGALELDTADYDLGRRAFVRQMNINAQNMGLKQTYFVNESGLDEDSVSGGYGSAIDVATLFQYMLKNHPDVLEPTKFPTINISSMDAVHNANNTNTDIGIIPGLLASKTGYTDIAGGNLAIAFDASIGRPIIVVVLGSTRESRFDDVSKLVSASLDYIKE